MQIYISDVTVVHPKHLEKDLRNSLAAISKLVILQAALYVLWNMIVINSITTRFRIVSELPAFHGPTSIVGYALNVRAKSPSP
jgi:hypothetical protein